MLDSCKVFLGVAFAVLSPQAQRPPDLVSAASIAEHLTRQSGFTIYLDSRVARERVPMLAIPKEVSAETLEEHLTALAKALPNKAIWAKLWLPRPPEGKTWKADDVIAYARAQAQLYGTVGSTKPGTVEILSQVLQADQAKRLIDDLKLKPVYIVTITRGTFVGVWKTTFGEMVLRQIGNKVTGNYTTGDGLIEGTVKGDVFTFRWFERGPGSGGQGIFTLSEDGESFSGQWANDSNLDSLSSWVGSRVSRRSL